jgi:DNA modification methylase
MSGEGETLTPAYQTDLVTVWHGDAAVILPTLATESVDLVATDPPYGAAFNSSFRQKRFGEIHNDRTDDRILIGDVLRECVRLVGQKRHLYVFGPSDVLAGLKVTEVANLVWDKGRTGMGDLSSAWGPAHEPITFAVSLHRHAGQAGASSPAVRMRKGSVLRFNPPTGRKVRHPNEKPIGLMRELIESSTRAGELVLDPFAGSGSTGVAALLSGRRAVLVESDKQWIPLIISRLTAAAEIVAMIGAA